MTNANIPSQKHQKFAARAYVEGEKVRIVPKPKEMAKVRMGENEVRIPKDTVRSRGVIKRLLANNGWSVAAARIYGIEKHDVARLHRTAKVRMMKKAEELSPE